jgi:hypothetical protein
LLLHQRISDVFRFGQDYYSAMADWLRDLDVVLETLYACLAVNFSDQCIFHSRMFVLQVSPARTFRLRAEMQSITPCLTL